MDDETAGVPRGPEGVHESPRAHPIAGEFVTETLPEYDGGRQVTVYVPPHPPEAVVFAGDGQGFSKWGRATRWAVSLRDAGADVVMGERAVSHGARLWRAEFPLMVAWAFGR